MNEEMMTMVEEIENNEVTDVEVYEETSKSGNGIVGKIAIGVVGAVVGAGALIYYKTKDKREERTIRKLEKKGYVINKAQDDVIEVKAEIVSEQNEEVQEEK